MNTNNPQHPQNSSLNYLRFGKCFVLTIGSAAMLATAGAVWAISPDEEKSSPEAVVNPSQSSRKQASFVTQAQPGSTATPVKWQLSTRSNVRKTDGRRWRHYLPNTSGVPKVYALRDQATVTNPSFLLPKEGSALNSAQFAELMSGRIDFSPQNIPPSGKRVDDSTPLQVGQEVLLRWEKTWWAATVIGFEPDGAIQVSYFGWPRRWDEAVPRTDLQLDTNTREKAIQTVYSYSP
jgi:hypothetical protein